MGSAATPSRDVAWRQWLSTGEQFLAPKMTLGLSRWCESSHSLPDFTRSQGSRSIRRGVEGGLRQVPKQSAAAMELGKIVGMGWHIYDRVIVSRPEDNEQQTTRFVWLDLWLFRAWRRAMGEKESSARGIRYGEDSADGAGEAGTWGPPAGRGRRWVCPRSSLVSERRRHATKFGRFVMARRGGYGRRGRRSSSVLCEVSLISRPHPPLTPEEKRKWAGGGEI
jgi:hypothetical protein